MLFLDILKKYSLLTLCLSHLKIMVADVKFTRYNIVLICTKYHIVFKEKSKMNIFLGVLKKNSLLTLY